MPSILAADQSGPSVWQQTLKHPACSQLPSSPVGALVVVRSTKKLQYKSISSPHQLVLLLHSPHTLLHLHFDPSRVLALPRAPCIVIMDNAPWTLDGFGHPPVCIWFQLVLGSVSVLFILGISSFQQMSYFRRIHFNASNLAFWQLGVAPVP
jgi:hypothetical protein